MPQALAVKVPGTMDLWRHDAREALRALVRDHAIVKDARGVIHAAGVLDDSVVANQSAERFARVMAPKVHGAWNLHRESLRHPVDMFVCFSSMASTMGAMGQIN